MAHTVETSTAPIAGGSRAEWDTEAHRARRTWWWVAALSLLFVLGRFSEGFEDDDMQHLHAAWLVGGGQVPYRDYFDHHMPLFHILFAPYTRLVGHDPLVLLVTSRLLALIPAVLTVYLFWRVAPPRAGALGAALGVLLFVVARHADLILELRPDYCALPWVLAAILLLAQGRRDTARNALAAGLCIGVALLLTQKNLALAPAFILWQGIAVLHAGTQRRASAVGLMALLAGMVVPVAALAVGLGHVGALRPFLDGPIGFVAHWVQPERWPFVAQEPVLANFPAMVLGYAWTLRAGWLWLRNGREVYRGDGLLALLSMAGTAGFLRTPAPTQQAFLLTVQVWVIACAVRQVIAWLAGDVPAPGRERLSWLWLCAGAAFSLLLLRYYNMAIALAASALLGFWARRIFAVPGPAGAKLVGVFAVLCTGTALASVVTAADRIHRAFFLSQVASMRAMERLVPPDGRVLTLWPVYTPLRPHATYHWFSDPGMYTSTPPGMLQNEYFAAMADPRTRMVVCEPAIVERLAPDVMRRIRQVFVEVEMPRQLRRARVFVRPDGT